MSVYSRCRLKPISLAQDIYNSYLLPNCKTQVKLDQWIYRDKVSPKDLSEKLKIFDKADIKKQFPSLFEDAPRHLEVCCGSGDFLVQIAKDYPDRRFIGVDIALPCLQRAMKKTQALNLKNLFFYNGSGEDFLLRDYHFLSLQLIMVNFPDPWLKKRHHKRRVVQTDLLKGAFAVLEKGGCVITATDVKNLCLDHIEKFQSSESSQPSQSPESQPLLQPQPQSKPQQWEEVGKQPLENVPMDYYNYPSAYQKKNLAGSTRIFYTQYRCKK